MKKLAIVMFALLLAGCGDDGYLDQNQFDKANESCKTVGSYPVRYEVTFLPKPGYNAVIMKRVTCKNKAIFEYQSNF